MTQRQRSFAREPGVGLDDGELPGYARMLEAYHRSRAVELRAILDTLPLRPGARVLDVASGDGWYSIELAARGMHIAAVDRSPAYLELAARRAAATPHGSQIVLEQADAAALPFADGVFDLAWCAQSFYSLPDPLAALREMARVTRPGGCVAVLENDSLHHILLPWPAELELAVRQAQLRALSERNGPASTAKFYVGRHLCDLFGQCGISQCDVRTFPVERRAPLSDDELLFLQMHFADLRRSIWPHLDQAARLAFQMLFDQDSNLCLFRRPDLHYTHLESLAVGIVGG